MSRSRGVPFYFNSATGETLWEPPVVKAAAPAAPPAGTQWRASHLLVKHAESRRPSSWRQVRLPRGPTCTSVWGRR
jgi:peptidyl-prolyl cis-trans isomerase NIMA-interacting 1